MNKEYKECLLDKGALCNNCNECDICDLDSSKLCDSCSKCINLDLADYGEIEIEGLLDNECEIDDFISDREELDRLHRMDSSLKSERAGDYEFIEDIPELKKRFDKI